MTQPDPLDDDDGRALGPGTVVAERYVLVARLGERGSAPVFEARDLVLSHARGREQRVALQLLPADFSRDERRLERLEAEFARVRTLAHPHIARVLDLGADAHGRFLATELLEGASVAAILEELSSAPLSKGEALAIVRAVGEALAYAHDRGIVHGGLDADSVFVTDDYDVKVKGFLRLRGEFEAGALAFSDWAGPDPRDDVKALARLACRLLAAGPDARGGAEPARPGRIRGLTRRQRKALSRALAARPEKRFTSMRAFLAALDLASADSLARAVHTREPARRRAGLLTAAALALGAVALGVYFAQDRIAATAAALDLEARIGSWFGDAARPGREGGEAAVTAPAGAGSARVPPVEPGTAPLERIELGPRVTRLPEPPGPSVPAPARERGAGSAADGETADAPPRAAERELERASEPPAVSDPAPAEARAAQAPAQRSAAPPELSFVQDSVTVPESAGVARLTVRRAEAGPSAAIAWWTVDGTARAPDDFADFARVVEEFPAGAREITILIPIVWDTVPEGPETFEVHVVEAVSEDDVGASRLQARITIVDDD